MLSTLQKTILTMRLLDDHKLVASLIVGYLRSLDDDEIFERHFDVIPSINECHSGVYENVPSNYSDLIHQSSLK